MDGAMSSSSGKVLGSAKAEVTTSKVAGRLAGATFVGGDGRAA